MLSGIIDIVIVLQAVEKVLAGAIRREMALEEYSAKQNTEIVHLNRLVGFFQVRKQNSVIMHLDHFLDFIQVTHWFLCILPVIIITGSTVQA